LKSGEEEEDLFVFNDTTEVEFWLFKSGVLTFQICTGMHAPLESL
jgi:hypothetical protein